MNDLSTGKVIEYSRKTCLACRPGGSAEWANNPCPPGHFPDVPVWPDLKTRRY
ncbi:MAG: hypothetical protein JW987_07445 [Anaerolineaceae bacterium]|nr:hypothetical protein [Anaerolineaceae bacterium]